MCPPMMSLSAGAMPRYGTWVILVPADTLSCSAAICIVVPAPAEP